MVLKYDYANGLNGTIIIEIFKYSKPARSFDKESIKPDDTLLTFNSLPLNKYQANHRPLKAGDILVVGILRNNKITEIPVVVGSLLAYAPGFFWSLFIIVILYSVGSLYLLYKKPNKTVWLFFIYLQLFVISINANHLFFTDSLAMAGNFVFQFSTCMLGPTLIHFHLLFPRSAKILIRFKR